MKHNSDKEFFEYLIKNVLLYYNLIDSNLFKSEKPDFKNKNIGLEITRADPTLEFDGFISKYKNKKIENIKKFNSNFEKIGGSVIEKNEPIVKILDLEDTFHFHDDYIYIIPSYSNDFNFINERITEKLENLNSKYDTKIDHYYLGIFSPILKFKDELENELKVILNLQSQYSRKYEKIIIVFVDKICEYNLLNNKCTIINDTNDILNEISKKTYDELKKQQ